jgi:hypothetical protein
MVKKSVATQVTRNTSKKRRRPIGQRQKTIHAHIAEEVYEKIERLVNEGWFPNREEIINDALRRFVDTHTPELMEKHILDDVKWGLRGGR